jgi:macrolide transport system ATP-binding/permease protein
MADTQPLIELVGLTKTYRTAGIAVPVLNGLSLCIHEGEFVAIIGTSGSGKTTLMNIIGCLDRPTSGSYRFAGRDVSQLSSDQLAELRGSTFGFIFQRYNLIATASAVENVEIPAIYGGVARRRRVPRARQLLMRLGLGDRLEHRPAQLSGGQQQRVAIARALMNGGRVLLADEPTGALDTASGSEVMKRLQSLHRSGHTVILVTHEPKLAALAQRTVQIEDGRIVSDTGPATGAEQRCGDDDSVQARLFEGADRRSGADFAQTARLALRSLRVNVFRTALTLLGIVIGVGAVVAMVALGDGSRHSVLARIEAMGTDLLVVRPGARNVRTPQDTASLVAEDADAIEELPGVLRVVPEYTGGVTLRVGENDYVTSGNATTDAYAAARRWSVAQGSFFSQQDLQSYAPVAVLGQTAASAVFAETDNPVGRYVLINNIPFQVVGVLAPKGATAFGGDMDDAVFIPLTTGRMRLFGRRYVRAITVQVARADRMDQVESEVQTLLAERHGKVDFQTRNMASLLETATETQNTLTVLLASIAAISLLVGGIGVMNIMLVSVTERVREIGIRMACGARMKHILHQFLVEAVVVCAAGGVAGVICGLTAALVAQGLGSAVVYSARPVLVAFGSALAIGLLFGLLPARRAASLDPVIALASE